MEGSSPLPSLSTEADKRTVFVGNLPRDVAKREVEDIFGEIGPIKRCYIQYPRGEKKQLDTTVAYVTYAIAEDATAALQQFSNQKIGGNKLIVKLSSSRSEQARETATPRPPPPGSVNAIPIEGPKPPREKPINKKSRIIVRNLSFQLTEQKLQEYFSTCGEIKELNILRKPNGKMVGCAFIQYVNVHQAIKAIQELNFKDFMGRPIAVDWAMPKKKFQKGEEEDSKQTITEESDDIKIKDEPLDSDEDDVKTEIKTEDDQKKSQRKRKARIGDDDDDCEEIPQKRVKRNDVEEGKTLFIRNLEFETTEDDLKQFFQTFGKLEYALMCKDKLTEHPKGTAFVKFKESSAANECIQKSHQEPAHFKLGRRQFYVSPAMSKEKLSEKGNEEKSTSDLKDKRNLFLAREGFIRPGSDSAEGVSATDMNQRASLNKTKKQMLKNLNIFVSNNRLCVHNLSPRFGDQDLKKLFAKHSPSEAKITEAKVMRDLNDTDLKGVGTSKGFGFITFTQHEHALQALRKLNNNPNIFSKNKRPIVEFSLENRMAVNAKLKRAERSKENNLNSNPSAKKLSRKEKRKAKRLEKSENDDKDEDSQNGEENDSQDVPAEDESETKPKKGKLARKAKKVDEKGKIPKYSGLTAKEGISKIPMNKPKGKITRKSLKPKKKRQEERRLREPKSRPKNSGKETEDAVDKMVSRYKQQQVGELKSKTKQKWYS